MCLSSNKILQQSKHWQKSLRSKKYLCFSIFFLFQVNVGQELLPSLLHTAKCYKIKGLDNVQTPPGLLEHNVSCHHVSRGAGKFLTCRDESKVPVHRHFINDNNLWQSQFWAIFGAKSWSNGNRIHFRLVQKLWFVMGTFHKLILHCSERCDTVWLPPSWPLS